VSDAAFEHLGLPARRTSDERTGGGLDHRAASARRLVGSSGSLGALDRLAGLAGSLLHAQAAQISLISDVQTVAGAAGSAAGATGQESLAAESLCTVTTTAARPVVVRDAPGDPRVSALPPVSSGAVGAYLGVPLVAADGHVIGALCVYESGPRAWTDDEVGLLEQLAAPVVAELELAALSTDYEGDQLVWQLAVDAAGIGAFDLDLASGALRWDDRLTSLFGVDGEFAGTVEAFLGLVHPDDTERVRDVLATAVEGCAAYAVEHRLLLPDGRVRWIASRGQALPGPDGRPVRVVGAAYDVTAAYEGEARVRRVLDEMPSAVLHLGPDWRVRYANPEAERITGMAREGLVGSVLWELFPETLDSDFERQYRHAVETGQPVSFDAYYPPPLDAWFEVRAWPTDGGLSLYFIDVTARHRSEQQLAATARRNDVLARVTDALTGTLDADEAATRLAPLLTADLADWCVVTLVDAADPTNWRVGLRDAGFAHADPEQQPLVERYAAVRLAALDDISFLARVLGSGEPLVVPRDATARVAAVLAEGEARDLLERLAPESAFVAPLGGRGRTVGLLSVFRGAGRAPFSREARDTLVELADRAGLAIDNARLYREQRDLAEGLQRSLMTAPPKPDHFQVAVRYEPAAEAAQVGGDWYDAFLQQDGATMMVIGDVVGHDTAAAAAMGQVRGLLRGIAVHSGAGPAAVLEGVDRVMDTLQLETTATAIVARLEHAPPDTAPGTTRVCWSNAGHPPPMVIDEHGLVSALAPGQPDLLLGLFPETRRSGHEVLLREGTTLLLYTDGLVERRGQPLDEGLDRLRHLLTDLAARDRGLDLEELCDEVLEVMLSDRPEDDVALVAVRLFG